MNEETPAPGTGALVGYARVSTADQAPALQVDALDRVGCVRVFTDYASGAKTARPQLAEAMDFLRPGDTLCVWRLDRLGRSLPHLLEVAQDLERRGVGLRSLQEAIDTSSPGGRLVFHIFGALAEFERGLIRERTHAGLAAARARGRKGGRRTVMTPARRKTALSLLRAVDETGRAAHTYAEVAEAIGVDRSTLVRHMSGVRPSAPDE